MHNSSRSFCFQNMSCYLGNQLWEQVANGQNVLVQLGGKCMIEC